MPQLTRRTAAAALAGAAMLRAAPRRPNFVFVYADDQRYDCLGAVQREQGAAARFPWFETPNLDRLAAGGIRFRNAFVVHSLCTPSRASYLTGRYTHSHGVYTNFTPFPAGMPNFGSLLRAAGYETAYIGKWHMGDQSGQRPGFSYSASYEGQGRYFHCPFEVNGQTAGTQGWVDDAATDFAIEFLRKRRSQPFALALGFKSPHADFNPPARLRNKFKGCKPGPAVNHTDLPIYLGRVHVADPRHEKSGGNRRVEDLLNYFRVIAGADENVGRLLKALDEAGLSEDTMVIYASDNGYHLGEHGIGDKRSAYEVSMRVPLLVRYPRLGRTGTADGMALNIDLAPTMLDFAGVPVPPEMQGRSWRPLLEGRAARIRDAFFYEYFFSYKDITDYEIQTANCPITPTIAAVRTGTAKLIKYPERDWVELFDLARDPYERDNLAALPEHAQLREQMERLHAREMKAVGFRYPPGYQPPPVEGLEEWRR